MTIRSIVPLRVRRMVPLQVRRAGVSAGARWEQARARVRDSFHRQSPTATPFQPSLKVALERSADAISPKEPLPIALPTSDELRRFWPSVLETIALLARTNPADKYFDLVNIERAREAGELSIHKDLFLVWMAIHDPPSRMLEIGCRTGRSIAIHLRARNRTSHVMAILIDPFVEMGSPHLVKKNLRRLRLEGRNHIHFLIGFSDRLLPALKEELPNLAFDYVLVDGSHDPEDALRDLRQITALVKDGGYVILDDIGGEYQLIEIWNQWKDECNKEGVKFEFREYDEPYAFAVARKLASGEC